jgi:hypothetical protein
VKLNGRGEKLIPLWKALRPEWVSNLSKVKQLTINWEKEFGGTKPKGFPANVHSPHCSPTSAILINPLKKTKTNKKKKFNWTRFKENQFWDQEVLWAQLKQSDQGVSKRPFTKYGN